MRMTASWSGSERTYRIQILCSEATNSGTRCRPPLSQRSATTHRGCAARKPRSFVRVMRLRKSTCPAPSAPCIWNTCFAMSKPIVVACFTDASFGGSSTPSPWHADAVGGRPPHHPSRPFATVVVKGSFRSRAAVVARLEKRGSTPCTSLTPEKIGAFRAEQPIGPVDHGGISAIPLGGRLNFSSGIGR
jgi:hypothetical protein